MPSEKRIDDRYPLKLTSNQRESRVHATRHAMDLKSRIKWAYDDPHFIEFTKKEREKMARGATPRSPTSTCSQEEAERHPRQDRRPPG